MAPNGHTTLIQAFGQYVSKHVMTMKGDKTETSKELQRFVQWCGPQKSMGDVTPSMIGDYVERVIGSGTTPQAPERLQAVRQFLSFAHKEKIIERRLAQHVRVRRARPRHGAGTLQEESPNPADCRRPRGSLSMNSRRSRLDAQSLLRRSAWLPPTRTSERTPPWKLPGRTREESRAG